MGVAAHLGIALDEYDARIRTFIPDYETMLDVAAAAVPRPARRLVDLGTGTGALAARCLSHLPRARVTGIDEDAAMLQVAATRLGRRAAFLTGSFLRVPLPACDIVTASFSLHHVRTQRAKAGLYRRIARAIGARGRFINVDCAPAADRRLRAAQFAAWRDHLRQAYTPKEADGLLRAWGREDVYVPLARELALLDASGLSAEVLWRRDAFVVVSAARRS